MTVFGRTWHLLSEMETGTSQTLLGLSVFSVNSLQFEMYDNGMQSKKITLARSRKPELLIVSYGGAYDRELLREMQGHSAPLQALR